MKVIKSESVKEEAKGLTKPINKEILKVFKLYIKKGSTLQRLDKLSPELFSLCVNYMMHYGGKDQYHAKNVKRKGMMPIPITLKMQAEMYKYMSAVTKQRSVTVYYNNMNTPMILLTK